MSFFMFIFMFKLSKMDVELLALRKKKGQELKTPAPFARILAHKQSNSSSFFLKIT